MMIYTRNVTAKIKKIKIKKLSKIFGDLLSFNLSGFKNSSNSGKPIRLEVMAAVIFH